jgi:hypothetical protein
MLLAGPPSRPGRALTVCQLPGLCCAPRLQVDVDRLLEVTTVERFLKYHIQAGGGLLLPAGVAQQARQLAGACAGVNRPGLKVAPSPRTTPHAAV